MYKEGEHGTPKGLYDRVELRDLVRTAAAAIERGDYGAAHWRLVDAAGLLGEKQTARFMVVRRPPEMMIPEGRS